jgi:porin
MDGWAANQANYKINETGDNMAYNCAVDGLALRAGSRIASTRAPRFLLCLLCAAAALLAAKPALADGTGDTPAADTTSEVDVVPATPSNSYARFDDLEEKGWAIPFPGTEDTIVGDTGGVRTALADSGFSFLGLSINQFQFNTLGGQHGGPQLFNGQKPTGLDLQTFFISYDLSHIGIQNAQLNFGLVNDVDSWAPLGPRTGVAISGINYYQSFLNGMIQMKVGYIKEDLEFVGLYVAGNLANGTLGPSATIPFEVGLSVNPTPTPALNLQANLGHFYNKFAVQRSVSPLGAEEERNENEYSLRFTVPGARALLVDEVGYRQPGGYSAWFRAGGIYNFSHYQDFRTGGESANNYALYGAADYQLIHTAVESYKGVYAGASAMYAPPAQNEFSQYYEARIYGLGLLPSRPFDMVSLIYDHTQFSQFARADEDQMGTQAFAGTNSITATYVFRVWNGIYVSGGLSYVDHPTFAPERKNAVVIQLALNLLF